VLDHPRPRIYYQANNKTKTAWGDSDDHRETVPVPRKLY